MVYMDVQNILALKCLCKSFSYDVVFKRAFGSHISNIVF